MPRQKKQRWPCISTNAFQHHLCMSAKTGKILRNTGHNTYIVSHFMAESSILILEEDYWGLAKM